MFTIQKTFLAVVILAMLGLISSQLTTIFLSKNIAENEDVNCSLPTNENCALAKRIQEKLISINCYTGPVDGIWSENTTSALARVNIRSDVTPALDVTLPKQDTLIRLDGLVSQAWRCFSKKRILKSLPRRKPTNRITTYSSNKPLLNAKRKKAAAPKRAVAREGGVSFGRPKKRAYRNDPFAGGR